MSALLDPSTDWFSLAAFNDVASLRSDAPEDFARLNRYPSVSAPLYFKRFGNGARTACLIQRNSPVLMVAHVDSVREPAAEAIMRDGKVYHNAIDNRLGVYMGLECLPAMGIDVDLLLTTGEEAGASTANLITTRKQYRWIFSFDRRGDDVVCYQYECPALTALLIGSGFRIGQGSYSCIADLEHLGCCGINFGCGMADYHSENSYFGVAALSKQVALFRDFYGKFAQMHFPHDPSEPRKEVHPWAVSIESLLWQLEYFASEGAEEAAFRCHLDISRLFAAAPELRNEFAGELARLPQFAV